MSEDTITQPGTENAAPGTENAAPGTVEPGTVEPGTVEPGTGEATEAAAAPKRTKAPDTSTVTLDGINAATLAIPDLIAASAPMRERSDAQKAMDKVAARAYAAWVKASRPSVWNKIPVITYFLSEEDVPKYKFLIRRACAIVEPEGDAPGVRVRFGNEFTLSEAMAAKIKDPESGEPRMDLAGKHVLAWAAVDKRASEDSKATAATSDAKTEDQPKTDGPKTEEAKTDGKRPGQVGRGKR